MTLVGLNIIDRANGKDEWLTPPELISSLGEFDLDPCSPIIRPWNTAKKHYTRIDDGLSKEWIGRVWLNPPYGQEVWKWLNRLKTHRNGIALIFGRTGSSGFHREIFCKDGAHSVLFIRGRLTFYHNTGVPARNNSGADSIIVSYDKPNTEAIGRSGIKGKMIIL